jgi:hypothetical protein
MHAIRPAAARGIFARRPRPLNVRLYASTACHARWPRQAPAPAQARRRGSGQVEVRSERAGPSPWPAPWAVRDTLSDGVWLSVPAAGCSGGAPLSSCTYGDTTQSMAHWHTARLCIGGGKLSPLVERQGEGERYQAVRHVCYHWSVCRWRGLAWLPVVCIAQRSSVHHFIPCLVSWSLGRHSLALATQGYWLDGRAAESSGATFRTYGRGACSSDEEKRGPLGGDRAPAGRSRRASHCCHCGCCS